MRDGVARERERARPTATSACRRRCPPPGRGRRREPVDHRARPPRPPSASPSRPRASSRGERPRRVPRGQAGSAGTGATSGCERGHVARGHAAVSIQVRTAVSGAAGGVGRERAVADAGDDEQLPLREARDDRHRVRGRRAHVEAAADREHRARSAAAPARAARRPTGSASRGRSRRCRAAPPTARTGRSEPAGAPRAPTARARRASRDRRVGRPRERAVPADGRGVERRAEVDRRLPGSLELSQVGEAGERLRVALARAACTTAGSSAASPGLRSASITTERTSSPSTCTGFFAPFGSVTAPCSGFAASWFASATTSPAEVVRRRLQPPSEQKAASVPGIDRSDVRAERVRQLRRQHRVEQQALDVIGMRERVGQRELRPVRDAVERDLVDAERLADGVEILRVRRRSM